MKIAIEAEKITTFRSLREWAVKGASKLRDFSCDEEIIFIDVIGNSCSTGEDMKFSEDTNRFPVTAYRLIRSIENQIE